MSSLLTTPLHDWHVANGARMVPFAGWSMPVQYRGILEEHKHTRTRASLFDISHMGEFLLEGPGATSILSRVVTHNLQTLAPGKCRYGFLLNERGSMLDARSGSLLGMRSHTGHPYLSHKQRIYQSYGYKP